MSVSAFSGFAHGLGASINRQKEREERDAQSARMDRYIDAMEAQPRATSFMPVQPRGMGATGFGAAPQQQVAHDGPPTLRALLTKYEGAGDPSTLFGHSQREGGRFAGVDVSQKTIGELREFTKPSGEYGQWVKQKLADSGQRARVATPMGFGQIVGTTMRNTADALGLPDDTVFDERTQQRMVDHLASQRLKNAQSPAAKRAAWRAEWEGFGKVPNSTLDAAIANFEAQGGVMPSRGMGAI